VPLAHRGQVLGLCNLFLTPDVTVAPQVLALLKTLGELLGLALHGERMERDALRATLIAERQLMAAEVHDSIAQTLAFAKMRIPLLESAVASGDAAAAQRYCADLRGAVGDAHGGLRRVLSHLREPADGPDFRATLAGCQHTLRERASVELAVDDRAPDLHLSAPQAHQVQRIVQEALNTIARHAGARHAWMTIARSGGDLEILVDDDGSGLPEGPPTDPEVHFGLGIMRQRAAILGGAIDFARRQEGGTRVRLRFPISPATAHAAA
jgi:two-component system nitrate/nitrite sensor histidine kinase NarX